MKQTKEEVEDILTAMEIKYYEDNNKDDIVFKINLKTDTYTLIIDNYGINFMDKNYKTIFNTNDTEEFGLKLFRFLKTNKHIKQ